MDVLAIHPVALCLGALVVAYETAGGVNEERISYER